MWTHAEQHVRSLAVKLRLKLLYVLCMYYVCTMYARFVSTRSQSFISESTVAHPGACLHYRPRFLFYEFNTLTRCTPVDKHEIFDY